MTTALPPVGLSTGIVALLVAWMSAGAASAQTAASPAPQAPVAAPRGPMLRTSEGIFSARDPDIVLTVRAGVSFSPAYLGSDDYELGPDVSARLDYVRFPNGFEYGSGRTVGFRSGWGLRGSVRYLGPRDSDDYDQIEGLDDVDWSFEAGLGVGYEQRNWRAFTDVRYGFIGHNSWVGEIGADNIFYPSEHLSLTLGPRFQFGSTRFAETYFGIDAAESVASGLPEFEAEGGLLGAGVELGARYLFDENWGVEGAASWSRLLNDASDSPVTDTGSSDQYKVRLGVTRSISLDF